jgi:hypothetical protein
MLIPLSLCGALAVHCRIHADCINSLYVLVRARFLAEPAQARFMSEFVLPVFEVLSRQLLQNCIDPRPAAVKKEMDGQAAAMGVSSAGGGAGSHVPASAAP